MVVAKVYEYKAQKKGASEYLHVDLTDGRKCRRSLCSLKKFTAPQIFRVFKENGCSVMHVISGEYIRSGIYRGC